MKRINRRGFRAVVIMCIIMFAIGMFSAMKKPVQADAPASAAAAQTAAAPAVVRDAEDPDLADLDTAYEYVDDYADNLEGDEHFSENITAAIDTVRTDVPAYATWLALLPALVAIVLALITKEVYSSLIIGIIVGGFIWATGNFERALIHIVVDGFIANLADLWNMGIVIFLVLLGAIVSMMNKAGGSAAFGRWAVTHIKTRVGAQIATIILGCIIFIDDYFNCLTVGSVMRPVTDGHRVSRAKLAYLIDATAAPVCIIAPVSSWAAAVSGFASAAGTTNGIGLFISAIPFNFYAILTVVMMLFLAFTNVDFGPMAKHERNAIENNDLFTTGVREAVEDKEVNPKGRVIDLVIPIVILIVCCIIGMIYSGGFFAGADFVTAFSDSDASVGLALGSFCATIIIVIYYMIRRLVPFRRLMRSLSQGFQAMVPAILILSCAWTLNAITGSLGAKIFISQLVEGSAAGLQIMLPFIIFLVAVGLSFATGTSWGTFGILIPIVLSVFPAGNPLQIVAMSACMAGAVCGDHCSPISDTTIMASAGAQCDHINHVSTQLPYALTVAAVSAVTYIIAGFLPNPVTLLIGIALMLAVLFIIRATVKKRSK